MRSVVIDGNGCRIATPIDADTLIGSIVDGIIGLDEHGRVLFANAAAADILGYARDELVGRQAHPLIHHTSADGLGHELSDCFIADSIRGARLNRRSSEILWKSTGEPVAVQLTVSPIIVEHAVHGVIISFSDVSEREELQRKLDECNRTAELGKMAATTAHEFNNVLMAIQPFTEAIVRRSIDQPHLLSAINHIREAVERGKGMTGEMLQYLRTGRLPEPGIVDLRAWLIEQEEELQLVLGSSHLLRMDLPEEPVEILGDGDLLARILVNLLINARDAMEPGGHVTAKLCPPREGQQYAELQLTDTGDGIPSSTIERIFEPLFTTKKHGTGLGLSIVRQSVESLAGRIDVESREGSGTTFHLLFRSAA